MKEFTVIYRNGDSKTINAPDKSVLIQDHFEGDQKKFRNEVSRLIWSSLSMHFVEDIDSKQKHAEITTADVNPYGWRNA